MAVERTDDPIVTQLNLFVTQYNKLQDKLDDLTFFDPQGNSKGILFGSGATLRIETSFANLLTSRYRGFGPVQSLEELGISLNDKGRLEFDQQEFRDKYATNQNAIQKLFTTAETGIAAKFVAVSEQLAGVENSTLIGRSSALQATIDRNVTRVLDFNKSLEHEREKLLAQFFRLEEVLARLQTNQAAIAQIRPISLLFNSSRR